MVPPKTIWAMAGWLTGMMILPCWEVGDGRVMDFFNAKALRRQGKRVGEREKTGGWFLVYRNFAPLRLRGSIY